MFHAVWLGQICMLGDRPAGLCMGAGGIANFVGACGLDGFSVCCGCLAKVFGCMVRNIRSSGFYFFGSPASV